MGRPLTHRAAAKTRPISWVDYEGAVLRRARRPTDMVLRDEYLVILSGGGCRSNSRQLRRPPTGLWPAGTPASRAARG